MQEEKKILMIGDDVNLVNIFKTVFVVNGFIFEAVHSASEGLKKIKEMDPDLIILDVIMEDFDAGFRIVSELRTSEPGSEYHSYSKVPILMLTSVTSKTTITFNEKVGTSLLPIDASMEKPVKPEELLEKVNEILNKKSGECNID